MSGVGEEYGFSIKNVPITSPNVSVINLGSPLT